MLDASGNPIMLNAQTSFVCKVRGMCHNLIYEVFTFKKSSQKIITAAAINCVTDNRTTTGYWTLCTVREMCSVLSVP